MFTRHFWVAVFVACFFACAGSPSRSQSLSPPGQSANASTNGPEDQSKTPAPDSDQLEQKVEALDKQNNDLKAEIDLLKKQQPATADGPKTSPTPRASEDSGAAAGAAWGVALASITGLCILLAVLFAAYTIWKSSENKKSTLAHSRREVPSSEEALAKFARAISHSAMGATFFQLAWSSPPEYEPTAFYHLADESIKYNKKAFDYCRDLRRRHKLFASEMNDVKWRSLNNMLFCIALQKEEGLRYFPQAVDYAKELRGASPLLEHPAWINTYCRFVLTFLDDFALCTKQSRSEIFADLDFLCRRQELTPVSKSSAEEFEKITNMLLAAKGQNSPSS